MVRIGTEQGDTSGLPIISSGQQFFFQKLLYVRIVFLAQCDLKCHVTAFLIKFTVQYKSISHNTFWITVIGIDKAFADGRFLDFLFCLVGQRVKKTLVFLYMLGIDTEFHPRFSGYECCQSPFAAV